MSQSESNPSPTDTKQTSISSKSTPSTESKYMDHDTTNHDLTITKTTNPTSVDTKNKLKVYVDELAQKTVPTDMTKPGTVCMDNDGQTDNV